MTTLAVPYYGHLYYDSIGYERIYFIVNYDTKAECPQDVLMKVWDERRTPELYSWLKENGVFGVVCHDPESRPLLKKAVNKGITMLGQSSRCAQSVMKMLLL